MEVQRRGFPEIGMDNDDVFIEMLIGVVGSVDELSHVDIVKTPFHLHVRVAPSTPVYFNNLLQEILKLNNMFSIRVEMGKSMKTNSTITFNIKINDYGKV